MGIQVPYKNLLALWVSFDTLYDTATNSACQLSDHGILRNFFFNQLINFISIIFFFRTFHLSPSREWITLKTLYLDINISVSWCYQHLWIRTIIIIFFILRTCFWRYKMFSGVSEYFWYSSSSSKFQNVLPLFHHSSRLLHSFLLQTWCAKMFTSLGNAWLYKNRFCTNLWLSN